MRIKILLLILIVSGLTQISFGQYQENLPQAKPIPPNAAALFKTLERPIGTYTGTIPINFPLCGVSSGSLTANLSLDYNSTGGIRVEELGGPIGLGFNLSDGGGRIVQMVRGKEDDASEGRLNNVYEKPSTFSCSNMYHLADYYSGALDLEPDIFLYSFNGHSGKFYLKENGDVVFMKEDEIKIEYSTSSIIDSWTITDQAGNKYHFNSRTANESSYSSNGGSTGSSISSVSWPLDYMEDMNSKNSIFFTYTTTGNTFSTYSGDFMPLSTAGSYCNGFNTTYDQGSVTTDGTEYLVSRIDASTGYVLINSVEAYSYGPKKITSIQLYDPAGNLKKQYKFNYGTSFESHRQKLINFSEFGSSGTDSITTKFEYIETENLPEVYSPSVDIWGFYNGAYNNNTGLIPNIHYSNGYLNINWTAWANRMANWGYARANLLRKITYPTGGYREIEYEGHTVNPSGDFYAYHDGVYNYPAGNWWNYRSFSETNFNNYGTYWPCLQHLFVVNSTTGSASFSYTLNNPDWTCGSYTVKIMELTDSTDLYGGSEKHSFTPGTSTGTYTLPNGYYRIDVGISDDAYYYWACTMDGIDGSWTECTYVDTTVSTSYGTLSRITRNGGGVRVKEIRDYDPTTDKISKREYKYKLYSIDSTLTSGLLASPVNILSIQNISECGCQYFAVCPGSSYPLSMDGGSYVVYPEVRTIDSVNGWTDHVYSYSADGTYSDFPLSPPTDNSAFRGKLLAEKIYDKNGTLIKKTVNSWGWSSIQSELGIKVKPYWYQGPGWAEAPSMGELPSMGACTNYYLETRSAPLVQTIDSLYSSFGTQAIQTDYSYYYYNNNYAYLKQRKNYINSNKTKEQTYKYAFTTNSDFKLGLSSSEQTMKSTLLDKHFMQPLEVVDSIKTNGSSPYLLSGAKYIFGKFNIDSSIYLKIFRSYATASDSTELNFSAYDSSGNLRQQYKTNDYSEVSLWGYNRSYVVAKITGSDLSTILGFINLSIVNNPSSEAALRTELEKIRSGLANSKAQVTTYTYAVPYGMSSMTDPAGRTTYYEYDLFGRLKLVRDYNGYIIKKYEYKMNNPQ